ncbi:glycerate kinase [Thermoflavimicrobium daqui]|uniref:Glycerate kinase n=1 Tax=Thermoflavimicrobium daqui TaxID=2137476 RepID=A0A364K659_9BACL|nr:glycerate kinase [Thermoflavimicrobium daqui]RAL25795.1 glycerate kinase [Thermoflavimicrobium daqui]
MKIVIAPDSYKGSLSSKEVGLIIQKAFQEEMPTADIEVVPMADGGEGTLETILFAVGGEKVDLEVTGPLGNRIMTSYGVLSDQETVVIEIAQVVGLPQIPQNQRNPMLTTTYGVGEQMIHALKRGYRKFIIGLGGSATNDGGLGMLQALGITFLDRDGSAVKPIGASLEKIKEVDFGTIHPEVLKCEIKVASDVKNPLCGKTGASYVFGPQKGATKEQVEKLDQGLAHYASLVENALDQSIQYVAGAGAAGGLGFGLLTIGAKILSGSQVLAEATGLEEKIKKADWVITGEGQSDFQTLYGKVPSFVAKLAKKYDSKTILISGSLGNGFEQLYEEFISCHSIAIGPLSIKESIASASKYLYICACNIARLLKASSN